MAEGQGKLLVCATPIGNLQDITLRVLQALQQAHVIAAEDTRHTRKLLSAFDIHVPLTAYHEHNRLGKGNLLLERVAAGETVVLVSDAGMPGISDPGEDLIRSCIAQGLPLEVLPGPSASVTALVLSGLPTDRFVFEGFLPQGKKERRERLQRLAQEERTMILYVAPHHWAATLKELTAVLGAERPAALVRELTKKFEQVLRGTLATLEADTADGVRGECTLVIGGRPPEEAAPLDWEADPEGCQLRLQAELARCREAGMDSKEALKAAALTMGIPKREAYRLQLALKGQE
ncbi:16S rRNA (cytidine1402-2'-O)-methyltransferase [Heliophilum fasciatum]|nr:16S rRNA (cytidine1402-2'-O)-methyltransferase [Heliophilum fasciatum]